MVFIEILVGLIVILLILVLYYRSKTHDIESQLKNVKFQKHSLSSKYGKMTEQFMPFLDSYPYDEQNFRFIGSPIDGVQFEDDKIIIIEFKTGDSQLTTRQREIKNLVKKGKVEFREFKMNKPR